MPYPHKSRKSRKGEAKVVIRDVVSYEQMQETVARLEILALGNAQVEADQVQPATEVIERLRQRQQVR